MSVLTTVMGLGKAVDSDNARTYLGTTLAAALDLVDAHAHEAGKGNPVKRIQSSVFGSRPAAGNAGHVHVSTDQNRLSADNGAAWLEAIIEGQTRVVTLAGGLLVSAGNIGVGIAPSAAVGLQLNSTLSGATAQYGLVCQCTSDSGATASVSGIYGRALTAAAAFTSAQVVSIFAAAPIKGAGSTITSAYGVYVEPVNAGNTNNFGVYINQASGGSGNNLALVIGNNAGRIGFLNGASTAYDTIGFNSTDYFHVTGAATSGAVGAASGQYWQVQIGGTNYKIQLLNP